MCIVSYTLVHPVFNKKFTNSNYLNYSSRHSRRRLHRLLSGAVSIYFGIGFYLKVISRIGKVKNRIEMNPAVLVTSFGATKPTEIINKIIELNGEPHTVQDFPVGSKNFPSHLCDIKTKYYQNTVALIPFEGDVNTIPTEILKITEAFIVFFDADDKSFLQQIPDVCKVIQNNNIELGILLTNKLCDDPALGITYQEAKITCKVLFDVIELCDSEDDEKESSDASTDQLNYNEVVQALQNYIWSNVKCPNRSSRQRSESNSDLDSVEGQLDAFEDLLTNIQNFKKVSSTLEREQVLDQAEKLAELFANIMNED